MMNSFYLLMQRKYSVVTKRIHQCLDSTLRDFVVLDIYTLVNFHLFLLHTVK